MLARTPNTHKIFIKQSPSSRDAEGKSGYPLNMSTGVVSNATHARLAAQDFQRGFPRAPSPFDLVRSGQRSLDDWLRVLEVRREQSERVFALEGRRLKTARVSQRTRLVILSRLELAPATIAELRESIGLTNTTLDPALNRLSTHGLVEARAQNSLEPRGGWCTDAGTFVWHLLPRGVRELAFLRDPSGQLCLESPVVNSPINTRSRSHP